MRLTDDQEAQIRVLADSYDDIAAKRYRALLGEVEALRAERDAWEAKFDSAWAEMRRIVAAGPEARIAAALALCDGWEERDDLPWVKQTAMITAVRAALAEPVEPQRRNEGPCPSCGIACPHHAPSCVGEPQPSACATCGDSRGECQGHVWCPSCTPPDPESETR